VDFEMIIGLLGGLGLFFYGMKMMGDGLENAAGSKLKFILEKVTANPISAVLVGTIVTGIIQSSSATTVMVVGFVNAGLMNLVQATGIIMGANIGTTVTAFIISLNMDAIVPIAIFFGAIMFMFSKAKKRRDLASILLGFGLLMEGMELMKVAMSPLKESAAFEQIILSIGSQWYLGLILGVVATAVIQSSSATTGILLAMTSTGKITMEVAFPMLLGANIGTCATALLSSIGTNKTARKAAVIHLLFNSTGTLIFMPLGTLMIGAVRSVTSPENIMMQIAYLHIMFNVLNTIILLPFSNLLIAAANKLIGTDEVTVSVTDRLDKRLLQTPSIAEGQVINETVRMAEIAKENFKLSFEAFLESDESNAERIFGNERTINELNEGITNFLVELSSSDIDINEFGRIASTYHVLNDIERIGDHSENIMELAQEKIRKGVEMTEDAVEELKSMFTYCIDALNIAIESYKNNDKKRAESMFRVEKRIDELEKEYRETHIRRLTHGKCTPIAGILFLDLISNMERVGDHANNVAEAVLGRYEE
jgi:phosphate:Na+ symporter